MVDAALIQQCSDPDLKPAIVEKFIERTGSQDPLAVTVRSGNRAVLIPKPATPDAAMALIRQHVGRNVVRVGITQYPAGLGVEEAGELKPDLVEACANLRMGTMMFAKILRIVSKWYGRPTSAEAYPYIFDDAIYAWKTGRFEGTAVFEAPDPGADGPTEVPGQDGIDAPNPPETQQQKDPATFRAEGSANLGDPVAGAKGSPEDAPIRVDMSGLKSRAD